MKTVMVLGAGVPRAAGHRRSQKKRPPLDADFFEIARKSHKKHCEYVVNRLADLVGDYSASLVRSLETSVTYLYLKAINAPAKSRHHYGFLAMLALINSVLATNTNDLVHGKSSLIYKFILRELKKLDNPANLSIITFNYDLLIENVLEEISIIYPETLNFPKCYRMSNHPNAQTVTVARKRAFTANGGAQKSEGVGLLKLHGSMNWQAMHSARYPKPQTLFSTQRDLHIMNAREISAQLWWKRGRRKFYMQPIIIPPINGKWGLMHQSITSLWVLAAQALRDANRVIIAGYSCPPFDLEAQILLGENLRQNKRKDLYVIDPNPQTAARFINLCGVKHAVIYSSIRDWLKMK